MRARTARRVDDDAAARRPVDRKGLASDRLERVAAKIERVRVDSQFAPAVLERPGDLLGGLRRHAAGDDEHALDLVDRLLDRSAATQPASDCVAETTRPKR